MRTVWEDVHQDLPQLLQLLVGASSFSLTFLKLLRVLVFFLQLLFAPCCQFIQLPFQLSFRLSFIGLSL